MMKVSRAAIEAADGGIPIGQAIPPYNSDGKRRRGRGGMTPRVGTRFARLVPLDPSSCTLRALTRHNAFSVLPAHLEITKRTHRFLSRKQQLSFSDTMSYAMKSRPKTVGSF